MYDHSIHDIHQWIDGAAFEAANEETATTNAMMLQDRPAEGRNEACGDSPSSSSSSSSSSCNEHDVLCGREKLCYRHPGNRAFHDLVRAHCGAYEAARRRVDKTRVALSIARAVEMRGGRFLQRSNNNNDKNNNNNNNEAGGEWVAVDPDKVHDKISHALRIAIKSSRRRQTAAVVMMRAHGRRGAPLFVADRSEDSDSDSAWEPLDDFLDDLALEPLDFNTRSIFDVAFFDVAALYE